MKTEKIFPNGFSSWQETHYEVVQYLTSTLDVENSLAIKTQETGGHGALYELAEELTDEFEKINQGKEWDGNFFDEIDLFLESKDI